jgi:Tol biopolymer transport system component
MNVGRTARLHRAAIAALSAVAILLPTVPRAQATTAIGTTTRVSVSSAGATANGFSSFSSVSADGRYIAFDSEAPDLVPDKTNRNIDVFVRDSVTGTTTRVSVSSSGAQGKGSVPQFSAPSISADGRFVAFSSYATNLVPNDTNGGRDVFLHDMVTGATTRISVSSSGAQLNGESDHPSISADGRFIAYTSRGVTGKTGKGRGIFVHDTATGITTLASVASDGTPANAGSAEPSISADGRFVAFSSVAKNLVTGDTNGKVHAFRGQDVFVHDMVSGSTIRVSVNTRGWQGNEASYAPSISSDGTSVAFVSDATNFVPGQTIESEVFVHDVATGKTSLVSASSAGVIGNHPSIQPEISADGRLIAFWSWASNLVPGDTNSKPPNAYSDYSGVGHLRARHLRPDDNQGLDHFEWWASE